MSYQLHHNANDIGGKKFGRLKAIKPTKDRVDGKVVWLCECECGNKHKVASRDLKSGNTKSCGCLTGGVTDIKGNKYGMLIVIKKVNIESKDGAYWLCGCKCGKEKTILGSSLRAGRTKSCGCLHKQKTSKHNKSNTRFYGIWQHMKKRCNQKDDQNYPLYGGRGIEVSKRWQEFENFMEDMYESYKEHIKKFGKNNTQIERVDNNKGYNKSNCKWATRKQQANNTRTNRFIKYNGKRQTLAQWSREKDIKYPTLRSRLDNGWSIERALEESVNR